MGEVVYPILDVYIDICHGRKRITYKKLDVIAVVENST